MRGDRRGGCWLLSHVSYVRSWADGAKIKSLPTRIYQDTHHTSRVFSGQTRLWCFWLAATFLSVYLEQGQHWGVGELELYKGMTCFSKPWTSRGNLSSATPHFLLRCCRGAFSKALNHPKLRRAAHEEGLTWRNHGKELPRYERAAVAPLNHANNPSCSIQYFSLHQGENAISSITKHTTGDHTVSHCIMGTWAFDEGTDKNLGAIPLKWSCDVHSLT